MYNELINRNKSVKLGRIKLSRKFAHVVMPEVYQMLSTGGVYWGLSCTPASLLCSVRRARYNFW